jgi:hypothetical protein
MGWHGKGLQWSPRAYKWLAVIAVVIILWNWWHGLRPW